MNLKVILNSPEKRKFGANSYIEKLVLQINPPETDKIRWSPLAPSINAQKAAKAVVRGANG
jgi:hypothetical protein